jgi:hypothetical protein
MVMRVRSSASSSFIIFRRGCRDAAFSSSSRMQLLMMMKLLDAEIQGEDSDGGINIKSEVAMELAALRRHIDTCWRCTKIA